MSTAELGNVGRGDDSIAWERLRRTVEAETGMDFSGRRLERLQQVVRKSFGEGADPVARFFRDDRPPVEILDRLVGEVTVGESYFFRNEHHFRVLRDTVVPEILKDNAGKRAIRAWSAGCATGEEPYSLSILFDELLRGDPSWHVSILATDLNQEFLRRAAAAAYRPWSFRQTSIGQDRRYFAAENDVLRIAPRIQRHVRFAYLNLVKDVYPSPLTNTLGLDLILFRNVAIYLKLEVTASILARFYQALRPGGWLLLGETEVTIAPVGGFEVRRFDNATFFQKPRTAAACELANVPLPSAPPAVAALPHDLNLFPASVFELPRWVPLPEIKARGDGRFRPSAGASKSNASSRPHAAPPVGIDRECIEQLIRNRRYSELNSFVGRASSVGTRAELRLHAVRALLASAESAKARAMLDQCLYEAPLNIEAQLLKASCSDEDGDLSAAEQACRKAVYIDPKSAMGHFHLALVLERRGCLAKAGRTLATTMKLVASQGPHVPVPHGDGVCFGRLQEIIAAMQHRRSSESVAAFSKPVRRIRDEFV